MVNSTLEIIGNLTVNVVVPESAEEYNSLVDAEHKTAFDQLMAFMLEKARRKIVGDYLAKGKEAAKKPENGFAIRQKVKDAEGNESWEKESAYIERLKANGIEVTIDAETFFAESVINGKTRGKSDEGIPEADEVQRNQVRRTVVARNLNGAAILQTELTGMIAVGLIDESRANNIIPVLVWDTIANNPKDSDAWIDAYLYGLSLVLAVKREGTGTKKIRRPKA